MATTFPPYYPQPPHLNYELQQPYHPEPHYFSPDDFYQQQQHPPQSDLSPSESSDPILALNLRVLRRHLPLTTSILFQAQYAVIYTFSHTGNGWEKSGKEGTLFIVRESTGACALVVLNRRGLDNFVMRDWDEQVQSEGGHIILRGRVEGESGFGGGGGGNEGEEGDLTVWGVWIWEEEGLGSTKGKRAGAELWLIECAKERERGGGMEEGVGEQQGGEEWHSDGEAFEEENDGKREPHLNGDHSAGVTHHRVQPNPQHQNSGNDQQQQQQQQQQWDYRPNLYNQTNQYHQFQQPPPPQPPHQPYPPHPQYQQQSHHPQPFLHQIPHLPPHSQHPHHAAHHPQSAHHPHPAQHPHPQYYQIPLDRFAALSSPQPQQYPAPGQTDGSGSPNLMALLNR